MHLAAAAKAKAKAEAAAAKAAAKAAKPKVLESKDIEPKDGKDAAGEGDKESAAEPETAKQTEGEEGAGTFTKVSPSKQGARRYEDQEALDAILFEHNYEHGIDENETVRAAPRALSSGARRPLRYSSARRTPH